MDCSVYRAVVASIFEVVRANGDGFWKELQSAKKSIVNSYSDSSLATPNASKIPFSDPAFQWAYAHLSVTPHARMVQEILGQFWTSKKKRSHFLTWHSQLLGGKMRVCCVGGGPGTDLLGLALFIRNHELEGLSIQCDVLDQWVKWKQTFNILVRHLNRQKFVLPFDCKDVKYCHFKFEERWSDYSVSGKYLLRLQYADLVTMVKFVSAVAAIDQCEQKLNIILRLMKEGALLFFLDNAGGGYSKTICSAAARAGLKQIAKIEHKDIGLPENEKECINSSGKLHRLGKTNPEKTWKVSAFLWKKENGQPCKTSPKKHPGISVQQGANQSPNYPNSNSSLKLPSKDTKHPSNPPTQRSLNPSKTSKPYPKFHNTKKRRKRKQTTKPENPVPTPNLPHCEYSAIQPTSHPSALYYPCNASQLDSMRGAQSHYLPLLQSPQLHTEPKPKNSATYTAAATGNLTMTQTLTFQRSIVQQSQLLQHAHINPTSSDTYTTLHNTARRIVACQPSNTHPSRYFQTAQPEEVASTSHTHSLLQPLNSNQVQTSQSLIGQPPEYSVQIPNSSQIQTSQLRSSSYNSSQCQIDQPTSIMQQMLPDLSSYQNSDMMPDSVLLNQEVSETLQSYSVDQSHLLDQSIDIKSAEEMGCCGSVMAFLFNLC